jgi:hypothetical protein
VVADDHADLGLTVVVVDRTVEVRLEPLYDFRIERLSGAADDAQPAPRPVGRVQPCRDQQAESRRCARQVSDPIFFDQAIRALGRERAVIERRRMAE